MNAGHGSALPGSVTVRVTERVLGIAKFMS